MDQFHRIFSYLIANPIIFMIFGEFDYFPQATHTENYIGFGEKTVLVPLWIPFDMTENVF